MKKAKRIFWALVFGAAVIAAVDYLTGMYLLVQTVGVAVWGFHVGAWLFAGIMLGGAIRSPSQDHSKKK